MADNLDELLTKLGQLAEAGWAELQKRYSPVPTIEEWLRDTRYQWEGIAAEQGVEGHQFMTKPPSVEDPWGLLLVVAADMRVKSLLWSPVPGASAAAVVPEQALSLFGFTSVEPSDSKSGVFSGQDLRGRWAKDALMEEHFDSLVVQPTGVPITELVLPSVLTERGFCPKCRKSSLVKNGAADHICLHCGFTVANIDNNL